MSGDMDGAGHDGGLFKQALLSYTAAALTV
jgi:hypothetical protein